MSAVYKISGIGCLATGAVIAIYGMFKSGAAEYSDTLNIGLLNDKTNLVLFGGFMAVIGAVFLAASALAPSHPADDVIEP